jgi:hypothetical protein
VPVRAPADGPDAGVRLLAERPWSEGCRVTRYVCDLCRQELGGLDDRCNSGIHQGPDDPNGARGRAVPVRDPFHYDPSTGVRFGFISTSESA